MQLSNMKAGEHLNPDLAKILKDKQKSEQKIQTDSAKAKAKFFSNFHANLSAKCK